jgi:alpha-D-ribose 1-methylphosphonate 5-triphosphate diphosphatase PhnM
MAAGITEAFFQLAIGEARVGDVRAGAFVEILGVIQTVADNPLNSGHYYFTDPNPATNSTRFYILHQP